MKYRYPHAEMASQKGGFKPLLNTPYNLMIYIGVGKENATSILPVAIFFQNLTNFSVLFVV